MGDWNKSEDGKAYARAYYLANKEKILGKSRRWYASNKDRVKGNVLRWREQNPEVVKRHDAKKAAKKRVALTGVGADAYAAMFSAQGGVCAICAEPETMRNRRTGAVYQLAADHDHATGRARALLCARCNRGIGYFRDDPDQLRLAAAYLESHRAQALRA